MEEKIDENETSNTFWRLRCQKRLSIELQNSTESCQKLHRNDVFAVFMFSSVICCFFFVGGFSKCGRRKFSARLVKWEIWVSKHSNIFYRNRHRQTFYFLKSQTQMLSQNISRNKTSVKLAWNYMLTCFKTVLANLDSGSFTSLRLSCQWVAPATILCVKFIR